MRMPLVCAYCSGGMSIIVFSTLSCPGRDAARSSCEALLRRTGTVPNTALCTAPALQRTAPQELRAALRGRNERRPSSARHAVRVRRQREGCFQRVVFMGQHVAQFLHMRDDVGAGNEAEIELV